MTAVWMWSGAAGPTSARAAVKQTSQTTLRVADNIGLSGAATYDITQWSPDPGVGIYDVTGLEPGSTYWYALTGDSNLIGKFRTHPPVDEPASFTFCYSGCAGTQPDYPAKTGLRPDKVSNHPVFDDIRVQDPLFFIHGGDLHYYNIGSQQAENAGLVGCNIAYYYDAYNTVLTQSRQGRLYREVATVHMWDDHDYGANDSDGTNPCKANAAQAYRECEPCYPLAQASGPIYHAFKVARVQFIALDIRYPSSAQADPDTSSKTRLGAAQKTWLENLLATTTSEVLCLIQGQRWNVLTFSTSTNWGAYQTERDELVEMLGDHGWLEKNRMFMVSSDVHASGINTGATNVFGHFPLLHGGSLDSRVGGGPNHGGMDLGWANSRGQYLVITVEDTGTRMTVTDQVMRH